MPAVSSFCTLQCDLKTYFSSRTGARPVSRTRPQYHSAASSIHGLNAVFRLAHTLVKPPFWWMP